MNKDEEKKRRFPDLERPANRNACFALYFALHAHASYKRYLDLFLYKNKMEGGHVKHGALSLAQRV